VESVLKLPLVLARLFAAAAAAGTLVVAALPATASAAPPANDNYLSSTRINNPDTVMPTAELTANEDTSEATTQSDLFSPRGSGGGAEPTLCGGVPFGKTLWYDFYPDIHGLMEFQTAGFDAVVNLYEFNRSTSLLTRLVDGCGNASGLTEDVYREVEAGHAYTVQIGGVDAGSGPAGGPLQIKFQFFGDRDHDGVFDALDHCPTIAGPQKTAGCPQDMKSTVTVTAQPSGGGIVVRSLTVKARKGAHVSLSCRRKCHLKEGRTAKTVSLRSIRGRFFPAGSSIVVKVTKPGFFGDYFRYDVKAGTFKKITRCTLPGSKMPRKHCP
jgi:hypothetical protein